MFPPIWQTNGMSLLNFGFTSNNARKGTTNKRLREEQEAWDSGCDQNNNSKDGTYDKKRVREFQSHWRDERPWLDYNDDTKTMFCSFCQSFPITADRSNALTRGTTNLRIEPIKIHESTPEHFSCHRSVSVVCTLLSGDSLAVVIKRWLVIKF